MGINIKSLDKLDNKLIVIISFVLRFALIIAFMAVIVHMVIGIYGVMLEIVGTPTSVEKLIYSLIDIIVEDSLLTVVIFEVYESIVDFFSGAGKAISYIINAAISFVAREIILTIFTITVYNTVDIYEMMGLATLIVALALSHYILLLRVDHTDHT